MQTNELLKRIWPNGVPVEELDLSDRIRAAMNDSAPAPVAAIGEVMARRAMSPRVARPVIESKRKTRAGQLERVRRLHRDHPRMTAAGIGRRLGLSAKHTLMYLREIDGLKMPGRSRKGMVRGATQARILEALATGPVTSKELSDALGMTPGAASGGLATLFLKGKLRRENLRASEGGPPEYRYSLAP